MQNIPIQPDSFNKLLNFRAEAQTPWALDAKTQPNTEKQGPLWTLPNL